MENRLDLEDMDTWKGLVYKTRNPPSFTSTNIEHVTIVKTKISEHNTFMNNLDSNSLVNGPIFANPGTFNVEDVQYIQDSSGNIPQQYAFKENTYVNIYSFMAGTILFQSFS